jgi:rRNA maturation protein Rpf1
MIILHSILEKGMIDSRELKVRNEQTDLGFLAREMFSTLLLKFMKNVSNVSIKITSSFAFHFDTAWKSFFRARRIREKLK